MLSNLLQELALARDHNRKRIVLDEGRLTENPVDRLSRMIISANHNHRANIFQQTIVNGKEKESSAVVLVLCRSCEQRGKMHPCRCFLDNRPNCRFQSAAARTCTNLRSLLCSSVQQQQVKLYHAT